MIKLNELGMKANWQKTRVMWIGRKQEVYNEENETDEGDEVP